MTPLEHALEHASRGFRVLSVFNVNAQGHCSCREGPACKSSGKHPSLTDWPNRATTDPDTIREWWGKRPERNIGLATGMGSGFFVLDIDPGKGGDDTLYDLELAYSPLPITWEVITATGGAHKFFRAVPDIPNSVDSLGVGLDIRGEGGMVVAVGSTRAQGTYEWELSSHPDDVPLADAPEWLLALIFRGGSASKKSVGPVTRDDLADWEKIKSGCPAMAYAAGEGQPRQSRPAWRHAVLNLISFCETPYEIAHEVSREHPQYSHEETEHEIRDALTNTRKPAKCKRIETAYGLGEFCKTCQYRDSRIGTPVTLGRPKPEVWQAGSGGRVLPEGVEKHPERPCYTEIASLDGDFKINGDDRHKVFFSLASQNRKQNHSPERAYNSLVEINGRRCFPKYQPREIEKVVGKAYQSGVVPTSGCDSIQLVGLCPAKEGRFPCPLYQSRQDARAEASAVASKDDERFSIVPMAVLWTTPVICYPTVLGEQVEVTEDIMMKWELFKAFITFHPKIAKVPELHQEHVSGSDGKRHRVPDQKVWEGVLREGLASRIDLPMPPDDASPEGIAWESVLSFIKDAKLTETREDLKRGRVLSEGDRLYFRFPDLLIYLKVNSLEVLGNNRLWAMLRRRGAEHGALRVGDRSFKVWHVPSDVLTPAEEPTITEKVFGAMLL